MIVEVFALGFVCLFFSRLRTSDVQLLIVLTVRLFSGPEEGKNSRLGGCVGRPGLQAPFHLELRWVGLELRLA